MSVDPAGASEVALRPGYHSPQVEVEVRLNTNESPEPPPDAFVEALADELRLHRLAPLSRPASDRRFARRSAPTTVSSRPRSSAPTGPTKPSNACSSPTAGRAGPAMLFEPTYALHSHIARLTGTPLVVGRRDRRLRRGPRRGRPNGRGRGPHDGPAGPAVTFLCSPNNPTGGAETEDNVRAVLGLVPGILAVDEAYGQFAPWSAIELVASEPRLVVVRTFSKTWAMAGLRLGYLVAHPEVVAASSNVALPYHLDAFKQVAGRLALGFDKEMRARVAATIQERERVARALSGLPVEVWPSDANFLLFRVSPRPGPGSGRACSSGPCSSATYPPGPGSRAAYGSPSGHAPENDRFLAALGEVLAGPDGAQPTAD